MVIISHASQLSGFLRVFEIACCFISSYVYIWFIAFENHNKGPFYSFQIYIEIIFMLLSVSKFLTDFIPDGEQIATQDLALIALNYIRNGFIWDLIPLLPLPFIFRAYKFVKLERYIFSIKLIRVVTGTNLFDVKELFQVIKDH